MTEEMKISINARLGSPIRQIELEQIHYDEAYQDAKDTLFLHEKVSNLTIHNEEFRQIWIKKYTIANCKEYLGRIRGKFGGIVGEGDTLRTMDHESLIAESLDEKSSLTYLLS